MMSPAYVSHRGTGVPNAGDWMITMHYAATIEAGATAAELDLSPRVLLSCVKMGILMIFHIFTGSMRESLGAIKSITSCT